MCARKPLRRLPSKAAESLDGESPLADWLAGFFVLSFVFSFVLSFVLSFAAARPAEIRPLSVTKACHKKVQAQSRQAQDHEALLLRSNARTMPTSSMARPPHKQV